MGRLSKALNWTTDYLNEMPVNTQVSVRDVPVKDKDLFIECVKQFIDWYGQVEFSGDFRIVRKINKIPEL